MSLRLIFIADGWLGRAGAYVSGSCVFNRKGSYLAPKSEFQVDLTVLFFRDSLRDGRICCAFLPSPTNYSLWVQVLSENFVVIGH